MSCNKKPTRADRKEVSTNKHQAPSTHTSAWPNVTHRHFLVEKFPLFKGHAMTLRYDLCHR